MDRVKIPSGSVQKLEEVFDDLQTLVHGNLNKRIDGITDEYGVFNALKNNTQVANSTGLKVTVSSAAEQQMTIQPGVALLVDGSVILVEDAFSFTIADAYTDGSITANTYYQINLKYKEVGTEPIVAMNAFFFDKAGLTPYSERYSRWSDSYEVVAYVRNIGSEIAVPDDEIPLAIILTDTSGSEIEQSDYTYTGAGAQMTAQDNIIDIRKDYTYRINHDMLDDQTLLFKDRDSTGSNKIVGNVEATGFLATTLTISGLSTLSTTNINGIATIENAGVSYLNVKAGNTYNAGIVYSDTAGQRGYTVFDYNHNYIVGFVTSFVDPNEEGSQPSTPPTASFVSTAGGYFGNYLTPTVELDLKNFSASADGTTIKLSHVPTTASTSTIFKFGVEYTGGTDPAYGRGYIMPITYNRPFEFLDYSGNYVLNIDNANRKVTAYSLQVNNATTLSTATITSATVSTLTSTTLSADTAELDNITNLSGLALLDNDASGIQLPGTGATEFRVGVGSSEYPLGRLVLLADPDVNTPNNFRIYDVDPTNNYKESLSYIHFKWNWDGLNGTKQSTDEVVLNSTTTTGEIVNITSGAATIRQFYFTSSGNLYDIDSYDAATRTVTLAEAHTGADIISDTYPAKIIDPDITYYTIRAIEVNDDGSLSQKAIIVTIDYDNIARDPQYAMKMELDKKWSISIKAGNKSYVSPYVTMQPGTYDPDHAAGGQTSVGYASPFYNRLPYIDGATSTPSMTLTPTAYGFKLDIEGWESDLRETSPHEFEVGYTTLSGMTWENSEFSTTRKSGATFIRTRNRTLYVTTNTDGQWTVGVRPIQNNQPVGTPILGVVNAGGGGIVPQDTIVVGPFDFDIVVASGTVTISGASENEYEITGANNELWGEGTLAGSTITFDASTETTILSNTLRYTET